MPLGRLGHTNDQVVRKHWDLVVQLVCERLRCIATYKGPIEAEALVRAGVRDPVRIFIKMEPHKKSKIATGKLRIISGVSLIDQIVERLLGGNQNEAEIAAWKTCPSKPGIDLSDEGLYHMSSYFKKELLRGRIMETDISGWDWSVKLWELLFDAECRRRLAGGIAGGAFDHFLKMQAYAVANSVFYLPDGDLVAQIDAGGQLSGSYWTSSTNSRMRVGLSLVARQMAGYVLMGAIGVCAMGDDSTEQEYEGVSSAIEKLGHLVKYLKFNNQVEGISFCSHEWMENGLAKPETVWKTFYRFLSHPTPMVHLCEWIVQLAVTLRHVHGEDAELIAELANARAGRAILFDV